MQEVAIVGGGPAGTLSALNLDGVKVTLFEEHQTPGFPAQCGGLISEDCLKLIKKYVSVEKFVLNRIKGAYFFSPSGEYLKLRGKSRGAVVERKLMDLELLKTCSLSGVNVFVKSKVRKVERKDGFFLLNVSNLPDFRADFVIGADGPQSTVARDLGFDRPKFLSAVQVDCWMECMDDNFVELYFGRDYSDFMFGYAIPVDGEFARVGVVSESNAITWFERLMKHPGLKGRIELKKEVELGCGAIPFGLVNFVRGRAILIGDSAGMVKPYTGGGIYYLALAAELLGKYFPDLERFRKEYMKRLGREYSAGKKIAKLYRELSDEEYDYLIKVGRKRAELARNLHMDRPSTLIKILPALLDVVRKPRLAVKIARCLL